MDNINTHSKTINRLVFGAFWAFSGQALGTIAGIFSAAILARLIDATQLGTYFIALSMVTIISAFFQFGLGRTTVRLISQSLALDNTQNAWLITKKIFLLATAFTILGSTLLYMFAIDYISLHLINTPELNSLKILLIIWAIAFTYRNLAAESFRGFHKIHIAVLLGDPLTRTVFVLLLAILWISNTSVDLRIVIYSMLVAILISAILGCVMLYKKSIPTRPNLSINYKMLLGISTPFFITGITNLAYTQADIWIISSMGTQDNVAIYGAALRLVLLVSGPLLILNAVLPSIITDLHTKGEISNLQYILRTASTLAGIPACALLLAFVVFGDHVLFFVYGPHYVEAHRILTILSIGHIAGVWTGSAGLTLMMTGHHKVIMTITIVSAFLLVICGIIAAKYFGVTGVATVNASVMVCSCIASLLLTKKHIGIWTHASTSYIHKKDILKIYNLLLTRIK